jgi:hypothetical protein
MPSDIDLDPPISHAIADGWANFSETVLPGIGGSAHAEAHIAFYFSAMYVLQMVKLIVADRSAEDAALALGVLDTEIEEFLQAHAVVVQ